MANYHTDEWVMERIREHYEEALTLIPEDRIVGIFCQGSTNYGLDTPESDIDTKLIVLPAWEDIVFAKEPVSYTYVRENNEHIDLKDIRLMFKTFRKQNINFIEILFTKYRIINPRYEKFWKVMDENKELIAHYDTYRALSTMRGMAYEKYHAMEHAYPSKADVLAKFAYDPKQLHHLIRLKEFITRYDAGESYEDCLISKDTEYLKQVKMGLYPVEVARTIAKETLSDIDEFYATKDKVEPNHEVDELLDNVLNGIMKEAYGVK